MGVGEEATSRTGPSPPPGILLLFFILFFVCKSGEEAASPTHPLAVPKVLAPSSSPLQQEDNVGLEREGSQTWGGGEAPTPSPIYLPVSSPSP